MAFQKKQKEALWKLYDYRILFYGGAKGGGKSWLARNWQLLRRLKYDGTHGLLVRKSYKEIYNNHVKKMLQEHPQLERYFNKTDMLLKLPNGSTLQFSYLNHTDDVYAYQGVEYDDIALEECTQHSEEVFKILKTSLRTVNPVIKPKFLLTGNPGGVGHAWVKRIFIDREFTENENPEDFGFLQAMVYDNDILMENNPEYLSDLKDLPEQKRKAYLEGDWDVFEGQFFGMWRPSKHIIPPRYQLNSAPASFRYVCGLDDGSTNPRAFCILAVDNDGGAEMIYEYYRAGEVASVAARNIKIELEDLGILELLQKKSYIAYDPAMDIKNNQTGQSTIDVFVSILGISKRRGNNHRVNGAKMVSEYLSWNELTEPLLHIWKTCTNFIRTIPSLIYDEHNNEDIDTEGEDHIYDALRYALMSIGILPSRLGGVQSTQEDKTKVKIQPIRRKYKPSGAI